MSSAELIRRIPQMNVLVFTEKRERSTQIRQFFQKAGFKSADNFNLGMKASDLPVYDYYFIEYHYSSHEVIAEIVDNARANAKFGKRPIFIVDIENEDSQVDDLNARELFPDFIVNSPINYGYIDELIKKSFNLTLLIEKLIAEVKGSQAAFIKRAQTFTGTYKNRMLLNMTLEELYKAKDFMTFKKVYQRHDKSEIMPQNLMAYCQMVEKPKAIPVLELLLRSKKYLFKANLMLAEIYEEAKQKSKQQASLSKAFENNPKSDSAFYSYLTFIIENNEHSLIHNMIMKRFYHIGITPVTLNKMILDIADTVYKSNHQFNKEKYRRFFGQLVITLKKRVSMDKRDELQGYINIFIARQLFKQGKRYKAKAIAATCYHRFLSERKVASDEFRVATFGVLAMAGEVKLCVALYKVFDQANLKKNSPQLLQQSMVHFQKLNKVYQWLRAQKSADENRLQLIKIGQTYPYSSDLNYMLLTLTLKGKNLMKNPENIKQCLAIIHRMERTNNTAGYENVMSSVEQNKKILIDVLLGSA
ncbi:hypothetical protein [Aliivibrio fischeri]|uniref:Response regulatory domain-containing protein n=1 Tax=Aliivibrio fischeri (strain ATCC 700601 / ES114) TaxID=312309 RepID=Q5E4M7_ALIF1|nr:hypothetical protein [Aliivibrio fischeri]AAW86019.1 hypothetical protein VF_1524 [Aliivibrio fischeri ES114]KLU79690.1 hypothetical protein AB192_09225 [Aliivibrio fischeri]MCE7536491.1 hypothetical protein [Aliivibrio fischeri]MCE7553573.1 hypothetical protein [Aliivibrio fischeri]MCE7559524.1 hypothetical protein [Aliivibrio fischeri]